MSEGREKTANTENLGISGAASVFFAWLCVIVANQFSAFRSAPPTMTLQAHLFVHLYDVGHLLAIALVFAGFCGIFRRFAPNRTSLAVLGIFLGALAVSIVAIPPDLSNSSVRLAEEHGEWITFAVLGGGVALFSLAPPLAFLVGRLSARPHWRWISMIVGTFASTTHALILNDFYHGIHLFIVISATTLFAAALTGAVLPTWSSRYFPRRPFPYLRNAFLALAASLAAYSIARPPPAKVAAELVRLDVFLLPHYLLRFVHAPTPLRIEPIPAEMSAWFVQRENHPPIAASSPPLFPENPIVILLTIDCLRADVVNSREHDALLHGLGGLRNGSVSFATARSTAPGTISSLASIFTSTHFSQQYWVPTGSWKTPFPDDHVRFTEILMQSGISTITFIGAPGLHPNFGLVRGFKELTDLPRAKGRYASAEALMTAAMKRLRKAQNERVFLHLHFLDAHYPYNLGVQRGTQFERYLSELSLVDQQLERLKQFLFAEGLADRTLLIVTADHGEAFGEHGTVHHSATIYDELLRVPLLFWRSKQPGRIPSEPVSLIDLGPTILDVFGLPTPGHFMGQSLVPFLRGENPKLTRPILAEARLKQALVLPDGYKVIVDNRLNTVELYDLRNDPDELNSLAEDEELLSRPLSLLRQFYDVHRNKTPGYTPPYRVW